MRMKIKDLVVAATVTGVAATALVACGGGSGGEVPIAGIWSAGEPADGSSGGANPTETPPPDPLADAPQSMKITWFGISNYHYQLGNLGILLDGETRAQGSAPDPASVKKAFASLTHEGTIDAILVGHDHGDHSLQIPEWGRQTGKPVYAPATVCQKMVAAGLPASQCTSLVGGEKIQLNNFVNVHVVRYVHSVDCGAFSNGVGGPETFGYLITAQTRKKGEVLSLFVNDSGAGGTDLTTPRVANGVTYGSPLANLAKAVKDAQLPHIDVWQVGPEARVVNQARIIVPAFDVRTLMPTHQNQRANTLSAFDLNYGTHYATSVDDQPKLKAFLQDAGVPQILPTNYFDRWEYSKSGVVKVGNAAAKAGWGLPADGPGPGVQGANPRAGALECPAD